MKSKLWLVLLLIVAPLVAGCGLQDTSTTVPSPSLSPVAEITASAIPTATPVSPALGQGVLMTIGQQGSGGGEFRNPQGLALDEQGNIYVADTGNARIQILDPQGNFLLAISDERFMGPRYIAVDDAGRIYVTDLSESVHVFNPRGDPLQSFGQPGSLPSQFSAIADLDVDAAGELYIVDSGNGRVQKFSLLSGPLFTFGDEGEPRELLNRPEGIALDADGNVYVGDAGNNRIQKYAPGGTFLRTLAAEVGEPRDMAIDEQGNIYVSNGDTGLIQVFDSQGHPLLELGQGQLDDPWGIAVDEEGRIFVADAGNHRLLLFVRAEEVPTPMPAPTTEASPAPEASPTALLPPIEGPAPWPMFGSNSQHTSHSLAEGPATPNLKWMFRAGILANSPALGADGGIYFGSLDGNLYALNPDGTEAWRAAFGQISGVPAISEEGTIHVGVASPMEKMFYAFNRDGSLGWGYHIESHIVESSPVIGPDGTIYLAASNPETARGAVIALNPDGSEKWRYEVGSRIPFSPTLGPDGTIYVGARNGNLYALNPDGSLKWQKNLGAVTSSAAVDAEGMIYLGTSTGYQALSPADGRQVWTYFPVDGEADSTPTLGRGGRIYLTSNSNELYALDPDGTRVWTFSAEEEEEKEVHFSSPITLDAGRVIYAGTREGELFAVNPDGSLRWRFPLPEGGMVLIGPAIGADGTLYAGAGSNLYAVGQ
jgi:outer membrane protein assembly factor BamB